MNEDEQPAGRDRITVQVDSSKNNKRPRSAGPYLAVILVLMLGLGFCLYLLVTNKGLGKPDQEGDGQQQSAPAQPAATPSETPDAAEIDLDKVNKAGDAAAQEPGEGQPAAASDSETIDPDSMISKMAMALSKYYLASSPEEKLKYVIDPERIAPLMRDFYFRHPFRPNEMAQLTPPQALPFEGRSFWRVQVTFKDGTSGFAAMRIIDGEPKIDWESEVRYSTKDWDAWIDDQNGGEADFRVYAIADMYYPAPFDDRARYVCVKLRVMGSNRTMFGYLDSQDPDQMPLIEQIMSGNMQECTLRLQQVKSDASSPVARVVKVLSTSWIVVSHDDEQS